MSESTPADALLSQWQALQQQFVSAWSEAAARAGHGNAAPNVWTDGLATWSKLFTPDTARGNETFERATAGARQFLEFLQAATAAASGQSNGFADAWQKATSSWTLHSNPALEAMRRASGEGAKSFEDLFAQFAQGAEPLRREFSVMTGLPAFGYARESQEHAQALARASADYAQRLAAYNALMLEASRKGMERFETKLAERSEPGREIKDLRALYDLWIDAVEEAYAEVALSPAFREAYGALVNAQSRMRLLVQADVERATAQLGMPTRSELDGTHRKLADLSRRLRRLERELGEADQHEHAPTRERGAQTRPAEGRAVEIEDRAGAEATRRQTARSGARFSDKDGKARGTVKARAAAPRKRRS